MSITSQVTMAWNGQELLIEAANPTTGAREKVVNLSFHDLPIEIQFTLRDNLSKIKAHKEMLEEYARKNDSKAREQREAEVNAHNAKMAAERDARFDAYLEGLAPHVVAYHQHKKAQRIAKSQRAAAGTIYETMASTQGQGIEFANKVMPKDRRPRRVEMTSTGNKVTYYYPQKEKFSTDKKVARKSPTKTVAARAKELGHINTNDFTF